MALQPKLKFEIKTSDKWVEMLSFLLLAANIALAIVAFLTLPETVPTHFNFKGDADAFGEKANVFAGPAMAFVLYVGITWLSFHPEIFNYPVKITEENADRQYRIAVRMIRWSKVSVNFIFLLITWSMYQSALQSTHQIQIWVILIITILPILPLIVYLNQATKKKSFQ